MSKRVLIIGAGYIGAQLGIELTALGHRVIGIRRRLEDRALPFPVVSLDVSEPQALDAFRNCREPFDWVIVAVSAGDSSESAYQQAYVTNLTTICESLQLQPWQRLVYISSTGVYEQESGEPIDETSRALGNGFKSRTLLRGEAIVQTSGAETVVLRFAGIYGPGRTRLLQQSLQPNPMPSNSLSNRIHRDDGVGSICHVLAKPKVDPCYIVCDENPVSQDEIMNWIRRAAKLSSTVSSADAKPLGGKRCSSALLRASGYQFRFPDYQAGFRALLAGQTSSSFNHSLPRGSDQTS